MRRERERARGDQGRRMWSAKRRSTPTREA
ncbi:unnamed protein product [Spirodela intermedia]|uniref:Uncharacterized protein n=1 Tax=Spirodela intermedia TaxID=51605 RepID=A0A7I8JRX3_SPIIN|nr:unnamed protein product [Spirodela intermedia]CAA6672172.1 unnamed protein product [Spirodela intermedia]